MENRSIYRYVILAVCVIAYTIAIFHRMSPAVMAKPLMHDLGVSAAFMGLLASAYFYSYAFMQVPSGVLSDKMSPRKLIVIALLFTAMGAFIFALAPNASVAFFGRLLVGIGCSLVLLPAYKILANWFSKKVYVIVLSTIIGASVGAGSMLAGAPLGYLVDEFGWRLSTQGIGILSVVVAVLGWFLLKDYPESSESQKSIDEIAKNPENEHEKLEEVSILVSFKIVLARFNFWLLAIAFFINCTIIFGFVGLWSGIYYTGVVGMSHTEMGSLLSLAATVTMVTPIIFASYITRFPSRKKILVWSNVALLFLMAYFYVRNGSYTMIEAYVWGISLSVTLTAPAGLFMAASRDLYPRNMASTANGLMYFIAMLGTAMFQPLIGYILDKMDYTDILSAEMFQPVCVLYLGISIMGVILLCFLREKDNELL